MRVLANTLARSLASFPERVLVNILVRSLVSFPERVLARGGVSHPEKPVSGSLVQLILTLLSV